MYPYISLTKEDQDLMLKKIGVSSVDDLFEAIPEEVRFKGSLDINSSMSEIEVMNHIKKLAKKNVNTDELTCFLGAGAYDHYIPSVIKHLVSRSEFFTAYTPYQPEISQGTLQAIFEYQTMIADLTGMEVANASMYDGATACAEAAQMAIDSTKRKTVLVSKTVHPETRTVLKTYMECKNFSVVEIDADGGATDAERLKEAMGKDVAAVIVQSPNFFGIIEDLTEIGNIAHENKSVFVVSADPISLGILKNPGEQGADIVVGDGQSLGNALNFGGPYLGFLATTSKYYRKIPGRLVGETTDKDGKRGFVLTLQAREQHIRRDKASSNICSNQALCALTALVYLTTMGKKGLREVAYQSMQKAHYAYDQMTSRGKYRKVFDKPFFKEFVVESDLPVEHVNRGLLENGILGGYDLGKDYPGYEKSLLFCVTEKRTRAEIDNLVDVMGGIE
jgi:glycine dehydrogenase subunit 1